MCMDGEIGCVATCASHMPLPSLDCPYPRRIQIPGKCCEEWLCDQSPVENPYHSVMAGECPVASVHLLLYVCLERGRSEVHFIRKSKAKAAAHIFKGAMPYYTISGGFEKRPILTSQVGVST